MVKQTPRTLILKYRLPDGGWAHRPGVAHCETRSAVLKAKGDDEFEIDADRTSKAAQELGYAESAVQCPIDSDDSKSAVIIAHKIGGVVELLITNRQAYLLNEDGKTVEVLH